MQKQKTPFKILCTILLIVNLISITTVSCRVSTATDAEQTKYVMYIGTNDKDTYQAEIPFDQCWKIVTDICLRHVNGCTISEAAGIWKDDKGISTTEKTLICTFDNVTEDTIKVIADELLTALNQSSILIERQNLTSYFYSGE